VHDSAFKAYPKAYHFLGRQYLKMMNTLIIHKASTIITPSEFSKQELMHYYGSNQNRIQVIPLAYNKDIYSNAIDSSKMLKQY